MQNTCEICGKDANFDKSPEGQLCGVCDLWICNDCHDAKAGCGNEPYKEEEYRIMARYLSDVSHYAEEKEIVEEV